MPRPRLKRRIGIQPDVTFYKPRGVPLKNLKIIEINLEEWEALRLKNVQEFNQIEAAKKMHTSQSTFQRILRSANKKMSYAIINGMAIKIIKK